MTNKKISIFDKDFNKDDKNILTKNGGNVEKSFLKSLNIYHQYLHSLNQLLLIEKYSRIRKERFSKNKSFEENKNKRSENQNELEK